MAETLGPILGGFGGGGGGGVTSVFSRTGVVTAQTGDYTVSQVTGAAPLANPAFTGNPTAPTQTAGNNSTRLATTAFVTSAVATGLATISPLTGDITSVGAATTLVGTPNVESIIRANTINQMGAPTASVNWNNQSITQLSSISMTDGTAADGQILSTLNPPLITAVGNSSNTGPIWQLGIVSSNPTLAFGPGVNAAADVILARTGTATATLTGAIGVSGLITAQGAITVLTGLTQTYTGALPTALSMWVGSTSTINVAFGGVGLMALGGTFLFQQGGFISTGFNFTPTFKNLAGHAVGFGSVSAIICGPTLTADTQSIAAGTLTGFFFNPTTSVTNSGTISSVSMVGYQSSVAGVGASTTVASLIDFSVVDAVGSGVVTLHVGLDVPALTKATTSIGIRNAAQTSFTPSSSQVVAAGFTVTANASHVQLTSTGPVTATIAAPIIAVPNTAANGQVLIIVNANTTTANTMIFTSGTTEKLSLGAATRTVGAGGSLTLVYNSAFGRWVEVAFNVGGN